MKPDGHSAPETVLEIVPLQHSGNGGGRRKLQGFRHGQQLQPLPVIAHLRLFLVQNPKYLLLIGFGIDQHLLGRHLPPALASGRGVSYGSGKIAYHNDDLMPQILQVLQLPQRHRMAKMKIRGAGIHAELDDERTP